MSPQPPRPGRPGFHTTFLCGLLLAQAGLLGYAASRHSPGIDEVGHLAAGLHHWKTGTFDLYRVNPPLVRLVATAPLAAAGVELPDLPMATAPPARAENELGRAFVAHHGDRSFHFFTRARWACLPFGLLGTWVIHAWATALYGRAAGSVSATLWVVCPNVLANAQMITPDAGAASLGACAGFLFWKHLQRPGWAGALAAGAVLGLAELTKTTWVVLVPLWVLLWVIDRVASRGRDRSGWTADGLRLTAMLLVALYVLNVGYGFEGTGTRLGRFHFISRALTTETEGPGRVNRFAGTWLGEIPLPVPRNYVQGIDAQKRDFEVGLRSYLRGEWRTGGWWYYYLYGLGVKTPLGTLGLAGLAVLSCGLVRRPGWRDEVILLAPGVVVLAFVSSQTGFNHHLRYVLPALPFFFVWIGRTVGYSGPGRGVWRAVIAVGVGSAALGSLAVYPHSLSYFNEAAGGPWRGPEHLVDSNLDWGQDLLELRRWLEEHPDARPLGLAYFGPVDPRVAGIEFRLPPRGDPRPGWYAISVTLLHGGTAYVPDGAGGYEHHQGPDYAYFLRARPVASAGYSIWIFHLDEADCARVRSELGLPHPAD
jgi:4-amino-4-deoxy-L-arabinose transferase-like glycosyltransferase